MPWNPNIYNQFKDIRFKPFFDLSAMITDQGAMKAIDLGCGTGEQTAILAEKFALAHFKGIDVSAEMLQNADKLAHSRLHFEQVKTEQMLKGSETWDLIFSNAALQWLPNHKSLFQNLIAHLSPNGQLAVQMPCQSDNILNQLLMELAAEPHFANALDGWNRPSPVMNLDAYTQLLFENGMRDLQLVIKVYPIVAESVDTLYNFIAGSALIPYLERLESNMQIDFIQSFKNKIASHFQKMPAIYPFKRILMYAKKAN